MNHFDNIADIYNKIWHFSDQYQEWIVTQISNRLAFCKEDVFVDIGAGTGKFTTLISTRAGFITPPLCVEPSKEMCAKAEENGGVRVICEDANGFINMAMRYDKILIKEVIHHVQDREHLWNGLYQQLQSGGRILVVTRPQNTTIPIFNAAKDEFFRNQPPYSAFVEELRKKEFAVEFNIDTYSFTLKKEAWKIMIRSRFLSDLKVFSDDEIENGIQEIDSKFSEDNITIDDTLVFITAWKT
jgi:SAM-dependent methyltransferase